MDWAESREHWPTLLKPYVGVPDLRFLEVGCYEGASTVWLLQHVLTDPTSRIDVVDTFTGQPYWSLDHRDFYDRFLANVQPWRDRVNESIGCSADILPTLRGPYDLVYIDGSHTAPNCLTDAVLAWPLLKPGGLMLFDDYNWDAPFPELQKPKVAVDAFVRVFADQLDGSEQGRQYVVRKK